MYSNSLFSIEYIYYLLFLKYFIYLINYYIHCGVPVN